VAEQCVQFVEWHPQQQQHWGQKNVSEHSKIPSASVAVVVDIDDAEEAADDVVGRKILQTEIFY
jgi:hypothetical protein